MVGGHTTLLLPEASSRRLSPHRNVSSPYHTREAEGKLGIRAGGQGLAVLQMLVISML